MQETTTLGGHRSLIDRLRQPEYVGENRCIPCTIVNTGIALAVSAGVISLLLWQGVQATVASGTGGVILLVSAVTIYLRGYLVPYTPTLTKRYLPDRVLALFDKYPGVEAGTDEEFTLVDVEEKLQSMNVLTECPNVDDLCLDPSFKQSWHAEMQQMQGQDLDEATIATLLDIDDPERVTVKSYGEAAIVKIDGRSAGQWESSAAIAADIAADSILRERYPEWDTIDVVNRSRLLNALRMFVESCPDCGQPVGIGQEVVESCCRTLDVAAVSCQACGTRVFEIELSDELKAAL